MMFPNSALYLGSKAAVEQFARSLSRELGPRNVTVNVLSITSPGLKIALGITAMPERIAAAMALPPDEACSVRI